MTWAAATAFAPRSARLAHLAFQSSGGRPPAPVGLPPRFRRPPLRPGIMPVGTVFTEMPTGGTGVFTGDALAPSRLAGATARARGRGKAKVSVRGLIVAPRGL